MNEVTQIKHKFSILGWLGKVFQSFVWTSDWYGTNHYFKFKVGDHVRVAYRNAAGYGIDAHGMVTELCVNKKDEDRYVIEMDKYDYEGVSEEDRIDFFQWMNGVERLPKDCKRIMEREIHFKCNIELHFKRDN